MSDDLADQKRKMVETLAGYGMPEEEIGLLLVPPIDLATLRQSYAAELEMGPVKANLETLSMLRAGVKKGNMTAVIWWTKVKMGWTERGPQSKDRPSENDDVPAPKLPGKKEMAKILHIQPRSSRRSSD